MNIIYAAFSPPTAILTLNEKHLRSSTAPVTLNEKHIRSSTTPLALNEKHMRGSWAARTLI